MALTPHAVETGKDTTAADSPFGTTESTQSSTVPGDPASGRPLRAVPLRIRFTSACKVHVEKTRTVEKRITASGSRGAIRRAIMSTTPSMRTSRATNVPVPSAPDSSMSVSLRMLTGVSTEMPGNVANGRPGAATTRSAAAPATPTAVAPRRSSVSAAADATRNSGTT